MRPVLRKAFLVVIGTVVVALTSFVYRNVRLDEGISALKADDYETALHKIEPLAAMGDSEAQRVIGKMYAFGWGVPKDDNKALTWLRRAGRWTSRTGYSSSIRIFRR